MTLVSKGFHRYLSLERGYMTSWGIHDVRKNARENLDLIKTAIEKRKEEKKGTGGKGNGASNNVGRRKARR